MLLTEFFQASYHCLSAWALLWNGNPNYFKAVYTLLAPDSHTEPGQWLKNKMFLDISWLPPFLASWLAFQPSSIWQWCPNFRRKKIQKRLHCPLFTTNKKLECQICQEIPLPKVKHLDKSQHSPQGLEESSYLLKGFTLLISSKGDM